MLEKFEKEFKFLNKLAAFITTVGVLGGVWYYYRTVIWYPNLKIISVDWDNGIAKVGKGNHIYTLYKNQTLAVGGDFGIRFSGPTDEITDRIELYKNWLTYDVIALKA